MKVQAYTRQMEKYMIGKIDLKNYEPYPKNPKNPKIAKFFKEIGLADELGSGMRNDEFGKNSNYIKYQIFKG